ncbi:MAG: hypothetical protein CW341_01190 [Bacteroidetes bacterium]|nr:hypothetical protein [Bacteroidota bacterium]
MLRLFWFMGTGYRVQGTGYRVQGTGCRLQGTGCRVQGTVGLSYYGSRKTIIIIQNSKFRIQIIEFWILNFEFKKNTQSAYP